MPHYMIQTAFKDTAAKAMIAKPQSRDDNARKTAESLGGKLHSFFFAFGEYDTIAIVELPDNQAAAAVALAVAAGGAVAKCQTTVLMTPTEAVGAMKKATAVAYKPPK